MRAYDFSPLFRYSVGFDRIEHLMTSAVNRADHSSSYPPYNIEALGDNTYRITMAVAGFGDGDLEITQKENSLVINGKARQGNGEVSYLHQGIASLEFERNFDLADYVKVTGANIQNGMLTVDLERKLPESLKPRKIAIKNGPANGLVDKAKKLLGTDEQVPA